jgi:hypothetical protein
VVHAGIGIDRRQRRAAAMGSAIEVRQWPNVTWSFPQFSGAVPQRLLERSRRIYVGRPLSRVTRDDLLTGVRPDWRRAIAGARAGAPPPGVRTFRMATV